MPIRPLLTVSLAVLAALTTVALAGAGTLDRVRESNTLRLGYRADAPPHSYADASGRPAGYIVDLCREVAAAVAQQMQPAQLKVDYVQVSAENRFEAVRAGEIDLLCDPSSITMTRREIVDFSLPTFIDGAGILAPRELVIERFEDLKGKRVGVLTGTTTEEMLRQAITGMNIRAELRIVQDHREGASLVSTSRLDAYVADRSILARMLLRREAPATLHLSPRYFSYETYGLAMQRGDDAFRLLVDRTLARIYRSGRIEEMIRRAFGSDPDDVLRMLIAINAVPN